MPLPLQKCEVCGVEKKAIWLHKKIHLPISQPVLPPMVPQGDELLKKIDDALSVMLGMKKDIDDLKEKVSPTATNQIQKAIDQESGTATIGGQLKTESIQGGLPEYKCHPRHKQLSDEILGTQFLVWESYDGVPSTHFQFNVKVPDSISPLKGQMPDIRSRAIMNAEGENGVRDWLLKIRQNLNKYYSVNALQSPFANVV